MKYAAVQPVVVPPGTVVGLTQAQADARRHCVRALPERPGWYLVAGDLHLKRSEALELDAAPSKTLAPLLQPQLRPARPARGAAVSAGA